MSKKTFYTREQLDDLDLFDLEEGEYSPDELRTPAKPTDDEIAAALAASKHRFPVKEDPYYPPGGN